MTPATWQFSCYGCNFEVVCSCPQLSQELPNWLPPIRQEVQGAIDYTFSIVPCAQGWDLIANGVSQVIVPYSEPTRTMAGVEYLVRMGMSEKSSDHAFVHAGVVSRHDRAILMPGHSFAGKSSLVRAFLEAGATYYTDECAVIDGRGLTPDPTRLAPSQLGAEVGTGPIPIVGVLLCTYREGARWSPSPVARGDVAVHLVHHCLTFHHPANRLRILRQVAAGAQALEGERGEASALVEQVQSLDWWRATAS